MNLLHYFKFKTSLSVEIFASAKMSRNAKIRCVTLGEGKTCLWIFSGLVGLLTHSLYMSINDYIFRSFERLRAANYKILVCNKNAQQRLEKTMYTANDVHVYDINLFHQR